MAQIFAIFKWRRTDHATSHWFNDIEPMACCMICTYVSVTPDWLGGMGELDIEMTMSICPLVRPSTTHSSFYVFVCTLLIEFNLNYIYLGLLWSHFMLHRFSKNQNFYVYAKIPCQIIYGFHYFVRLRIYIINWLLLSDGSFQYQSAHFW